MLKERRVSYLYLNSISLVSLTLHNTYSTWEDLFVDIIDDSGRISQSVIYTDHQE